MLIVRDLHAFYGQSHVLQGLSFDMAAGECVALLGRNSAGRTTTARALMGLLPSRGLVQWQGWDLARLPTHARAMRGVGYVPEHRDVFPGLTVEQNLLLGIKKQAFRKPASAPAWSFSEVYQLFPSLRERARTPAGLLSGGEQQMLSLGRTLMGNPSLLLVDEPTEGLAPALVEQVALCLSTLRAQGVAVLLIEQKRQMALSLADRCIVLGHGRVVFDGSPAELYRAEALAMQWLDF